MENEGQAVNRPPLFKGVNYDYWKQRMIAFFDACHIDMWEVVEQGDYIPKDTEGKEIPKAEWNEAQKQRFLLNSKARNAIMCALSEEEYTKVHSFKSAKKMWDTLSLTYEGSIEVKRNKLSLLTRKYELFEMEENETIQTMFSRFQTIINELSFLGRTYDIFDHIDKLLRSLPRKWRPQVTALRASKNLEKMTLEELIGLLKVHEMELQQDETTTKRQKSIALAAQKKSKSASSSKALKTEESSAESSEEIDDDSEDELSFISRRIQSIMRKKGGSRWRKFNKMPRSKAQVICYQCRNPGHFKAECPENNQDKEEEDKKKPTHFKKKKKAMMATWEDLSSSEEEEIEEANICRITDTGSSSGSDDEEVTILDFDSIRLAYDELLVDSAKLSDAYREQKKKNIELAKENAMLKDEKEKSNKSNKLHVDQENEIIKLNQEIAVLKQDLVKFTYSTKALDNMIMNARHSNNKTGLGYTEENNVKTTISACSYCGKPGHAKADCIHAKTGHSKNPKPKVNKENITKCTSCNKIGHVKSKCVYNKRPEIRRIKKKGFDIGRCVYCKKDGHIMPECIHMLKRYSETSVINYHGPKFHWVPKSKIVSVADSFNKLKKAEILTSGRWITATHDGRKVYIPKPETQERRPSHIWKGTKIIYHGERLC